MTNHPTKATKSEDFGFEPRSTPQKHMDVEAIRNEALNIYSEVMFAPDKSIAIASIERALTTQATQYEESIAHAVKVAKVEAWNDAVELSDRLEAGNTKFDEWRAFKGFRNGLRDKIRELVSPQNRTIDISDKIK